MRLWVWLRGLRWAVAQDWTETTTAQGLDHDACRTSTGGHQHMRTWMRAPVLLWPVQSRWGKNAPALTVSQVRRLLEVLLPLRRLTLAEG